MYLLEIRTEKNKKLYDSFFFDRENRIAVKLFLKISL